MSTSAHEAVADGRDEKDRVEGEDQSNNPRKFVGRIGRRLSPKVENVSDELAE